MKGVLMLLKSAGVNVTPEDMKKLEELIPKIPGLLQEGIQVINASLKNFDYRLKTLEENQAIMQAMLVRLLESKDESERSNAA